MKHENVNSLVAVAGLCVALFSTGLQLWPKSDTLELAPRRMAMLSDYPIEMKKGHALHDELDSPAQKDEWPRPAGVTFPAYWTVDVYNPLDRAVVLTDIGILVKGPASDTPSARKPLDRAGMAVTSVFEPSYFHPGIFYFLNGDAPEEMLPMSIGPRQFLSLTFAPGKRFIAQNQEHEACFRNARGPIQLRDCNLAQGLDEFGAPAETPWERTSNRRELTEKHVDYEVMFLTAGNEVLELDLLMPDGGF